MKLLYKPPEITVEELEKADVLCLSDPTEPTLPPLDNQSVLMERILGLKTIG